ncbi:hypothetical protein ACIHFD_49085 [Nonomuraea sp. NPDC051941]|uniref:hypothetical protein n=1 Tax=Nonomuraea sp. NPDC051941 TaxID=3364373 RepID=UPI0037C54A2F
MGEMRGGRRADHPWLVPAGDIPNAGPTAGESEDLEQRVREDIAAEIAAERIDCPDHPDPRLPRRGCPRCAHNGMVERFVRVALGGASVPWTPKEATGPAPLPVEQVWRVILGKRS